MQSLGPREVIAVQLGTLDRRCTQRLTVGTGTYDVPILSTEVIKTVVVGSEAQGAQHCLTHSVEVTLGGVECHSYRQDLEGVLRQARENVEQRLSVSTVVSEQEIVLRGCNERVAGEEDVEQADADRPNVCLCRRIANASRVVLFRCHVTITTNTRVIRPQALGGQTKVAELHVAVVTQKDVLGFDVTVVVATGMHMLDGTDELQHEATNMFSLERTTFKSDGLIQVTLIAVLEYQVGVGMRGEAVDQIDKVRMILQGIVTVKLNSALVMCRDVLLRSCQTLDSHLLSGGHVFGQEDHPE